MLHCKAGHPIPPPGPGMGCTAQQASPSPRQPILYGTNKKHCDVLRKRPRKEGKMFCILIPLTAFFSIDSFQRRALLLSCAPGLLQPSWELRQQIPHEAKKSLPAEPSPNCRFLSQSNGCCACRSLSLGRAWVSGWLCRKR